MAGKQQYTDEAKAQAFHQLAVNDGNVKRTARELGLPVSTLRTWKAEWEADKNLPALEDVQQASGDFIADAERVRNLALQHMERSLGKASPAQLATIVGVLDDKIARARGLANRVEHEHRIALPSAEDIAQTLVQLQEMARDGASRRQAEILDADLVEHKALPAAK
jgi:transposase-like protein